MTQQSALHRAAVPALVLVALLVLLGPAPSAHAVPGRRLALLTFNIHHAAGQDGRVDLDRLAAEIRASGAEVVGLQEVDRHYGERSGSADQAGELARLLGMHLAFGANVDLAPSAPGEPRRQYGTALLSRYPIVSSGNTALPVDAGEEPRGLLDALLSVAGTRVRVLTTHLSADDGGERRAQARAVAARVRASAEPVLLLGDLNAATGAPELDALVGLLGETGCGGGPSFPAGTPTTRIDHVLGEGPFLGCTVLPTASSDHRPVLAGVLVGP
jgi:endonuclease/exonuclease/phosphatase family metal-dependent hydrolase